MLLRIVSFGLRLCNSLFRPEPQCWIKKSLFRQLVASSISSHLPYRPHHDLAAVPQFPTSSQDHTALVDTLALERKKLQRWHTQRLAPLSLKKEKHF